jgi:hypothetical protein
LLAKDYPWLKVHAICVDYADPWSLPPGLTGKNRIAFSPAPVLAIYLRKKQWICLGDSLSSLVMMAVY